MPRDPRKVQKRRIEPDTKYNSILVAKFINKVMLDGKKQLATKLVYGAIEEAAGKTGKPGLEVFEVAIKNVSPVVQVKSRRIGGATYQVPMEVRPERRQTLGLRWITKYARLRNEKTMKERLAGEILDAINGSGGACKKRDDTHKMAEANKAFARFASK